MTAMAREIKMNYLCISASVFVQTGHSRGKFQFELQNRDAMVKKKSTSSQQLSLLLVLSIKDQPTPGSLNH